MAVAKITLSFFFGEGRVSLCVMCRDGETEEIREERGGWREGEGDLPPSLQEKVTGPNGRGKIAGREGGCRV